MGDLTGDVTITGTVPLGTSGVGNVLPFVLVMVKGGGPLAALALTGSVVEVVVGVGFWPLTPLAPLGWRRWADLGISLLRFLSATSSSSSSEVSESITTLGFFFPTFGLRVDEVLGGVSSPLETSEADLGFTPLPLGIVTASVRWIETDSRGKDWSELKEQIGKGIIEERKEGDEQFLLRQEESKKGLCESTKQWCNIVGISTGILTGVCS